MAAVSCDMSGQVQSKQQINNKVNKVDHNIHVYITYLLLIGSQEFRLVLFRIL